MARFASVVTCDTCGGALETVPGLGLMCSNGCSFDHLGKVGKTESAPPPRPEASRDWRGQSFQNPASRTPPAPARPPAPLPLAKAAPEGAWEVFDVRTTTRGAASTRLGKNGQLLIGAVLARQLGDPERVELRYDKAGQRIGLAPTAQAHGARVSRTGKAKQIRVSLLGMFNHFGLKLPEKNVAIDARVEDGVLILPVQGFDHD